MSAPESRRIETDFTKLWSSLLMNDYKVDMINDQMQQFYVHFHGPNESLYQGGVWKVKVILPNEYPFRPPVIRFMNKIYHPNIEERSGSVCVNVLSEDWKPMYDLVNLFELFLPQLLQQPNASDPLNREAAELMLSDINSYERRVREYCMTYAKPEEKSSDEERSEDQSDSTDEQIAGNADP